MMSDIKRMPAAVELKIVMEERERYREALEEIAGIGHPVSEIEAGCMIDIAEQALNSEKQDD